MPRFGVMALSIMVVASAWVIAALVMVDAVDKRRWASAVAQVDEADVQVYSDDDSTWWIVTAQVRWTYDDVPYVSPPDEPWEQRFDSEAQATIEAERSTLPVWVDPEAPHRFIPKPVTPAQVYAHAGYIALLTTLLTALLWRVRTARQWHKRASRWLVQDSPVSGVHTFEDANGALIVARAGDTGVVAALAWPLFPILFGLAGFQGIAGASGWNAVILIIPLAVAGGSTVWFLRDYFQLDMIRFGDEELRYEGSRLSGALESTIPKAAVVSVVGRKGEDSSGNEPWSVVVRAARTLTVYEDRNSEAAQWLTHALASWAGVAPTIKD